MTIVIITMTITMIIAIMAFFPSTVQGWNATHGSPSILESQPSSSDPDSATIKDLTVAITAGTFLIFVVGFLACIAAIVALPFIILGVSDGRYFRPWHFRRFRRRFWPVAPRREQNVETGNGNRLGDNVNPGHGLQAPAPVRLGPQLPARRLRHLPSVNSVASSTGGSLSSSSTGSSTSSATEPLAVDPRFMHVQDVELMAIGTNPHLRDLPPPVPGEEGIPVPVEATDPSAIDLTDTSGARRGGLVPFLTPVSGDFSSEQLAQFDTEFAAVGQRQQLHHYHHHHHHHHHQQQQQAMAAVTAPGHLGRDTTTFSGSTVGPSSTTGSRARPLSRVQTLSTRNNGVSRHANESSAAAAAAAANSTTTTTISESLGFDGRTAVSTESADDAGSTSPTTLHHHLAAEAVEVDVFPGGGTSEPDGQTGGTTVMSSAAGLDDRNSRPASHDVESGSRTVPSAADTSTSEETVALPGRSSEDSYATALEKPEAS